MRLAHAPIIAAAALAALCAPPSRAGDTCEPHWTDPWNGALPNQDVQAIVQLPDDFPGGGGIVIAGSFSMVGEVPCAFIARWDGGQWHPLGSGANDVVNALTVFDDGTGPALYAGGRFTSIGGVAASMVARWDGQSWSQVGAGLGFPGETGILDFAVFDEGDGLRLIAGGFFSIPFVSAGIARWDGHSWTNIGDFATTGGSVSCLRVHDDGAGPSLYVGGSFTSVNALAGTRGIARWDGASWSSVGSGIDGTFTNIYSIASYESGETQQLVIGGDFLSVGGVAARNLARWDGVEWSHIAGLVGYAEDQFLVEDLHAHNDGSGPALFVSGRFAGTASIASRNIIKWDGADWHGVGGGTSGGPLGWGDVVSLATMESEDGPVLLIGGYFTMAGPNLQPKLAAWQGCAAACVGDLDGDGLVNFTDLNLLLDDYNQTGPGLPGDLDADMDVDFADLNLLLGAYNSEC